LKYCKSTNCGNPVFGGGYCKWHQWKRTDKTPYQYIKKKTGEREVFEMIWNEREHKSFLSGKALGTFCVSYFAHVLSKAQNKYPKFKLYKKNIILLTIEEHHLLDQGTEKARKEYEIKENCSFNKIKKLYDENKREYEKKHS